MKRSSHPDQPARERAALFAMGALPPEEATSYEAHLAACPACTVEIEALRGVASELVLLVPKATPPSGLRSRVLNRVRDAAALDPAVRGIQAAAPHLPWKTAPQTALKAGFAYAFASSGGWEQTSFRGVEARQLFVDAVNDRATMLVKMAPGASYPSHRHAGREECYVIQGDLQSGDVSMGAGDYKLADMGSIDELQSTRDGCLLLIVSSQHDELLPGTRA